MEHTKVQETVCVKCCKADHRAVIGRSLNGCPRQQLILHQYWKYCLARPMDQMIVTYTWPPAHHLIHCIFICTLGASIFVNENDLLPKCAIIILLVLTVLLGVKISKTSVLSSLIHHWQSLDTFCLYGMQHNALCCWLN